MLGKKKGGGPAGFGGFLAEGTEIDGEVRFVDELRIDGRVNGRVVSKGGHLLVGETAILEADIDVAAASISGTVSGTLMASSRVEIHPTGKVFGDIHSPALIMEEGAIHDGRNEMSKAKAPKPLDEVRPERPLKTGAA